MKLFNKMEISESHSNYQYYAQNPFQQNTGKPADTMGTQEDNGNFI